MYFFTPDTPKENRVGRKLADPMAAFWEDGHGPSHSVINRKFTLADLEIPEGSKTTKVFNGFLAADDTQALVLLDGLLELLRKYSAATLRESPRGKALRESLESLGIKISEDFQIDVQKAATKTQPPTNPDPGESIPIPGWQEDPSPSDLTDEEAKEIHAAERSVDPPKEIFLVHGHDLGALGEIERFVRKETGIDPIILSEQTNNGKTLIEKFEHYSANAAYAIIIMTPDDVARAVKDPKEDETGRARENVVFEMGYFYGRLGRSNVSVLSFGTKLPGDINGLVYINEANWKYDLGQELASAGFKFQR